MADQKTTDAAITPAIKIYYNRLMIDRLEPKTRLVQFGEAADIPANEGTQAEWTGWRPNKPIMANGSELTQNQVYLSSYKINATLILRHGYAKLSTLVIDTMIDKNVKGAVGVISDQLAKTVEDYLRQNVIGRLGNAKRSSINNLGYNTDTTNVDTDGMFTTISSQRTHHFYSPYPILHNKQRLSSSGAELAANIAGSAMTVNQIRHGVSYLKSRNAEGLDGDLFVLYCHTWVADVIMQDPKWATWNKYNHVEKMFRGEVGHIFGARVVTSNMSLRYVYSAAPLTTASGAMNYSFLIGKGGNTRAFGVTRLTPQMGNDQGFEIFVKRPGPHSTDQPVDLFSTVGGKMVMAAAILNKSAACVIATTDRVATSGT